MPIGLATAAPAGSKGWDKRVSIKKRRGTSYVLILCLTLGNYGFLNVCAPSAADDHSFIHR